MGRTFPWALFGVQLFYSFFVFLPRYITYSTLFRQKAAKAALWRSRRYFIAIRCRNGNNLVIKLPCVDVCTQVCSCCWTEWRERNGTSSAPTRKVAPENCLIATPRSTWTRASSSQAGVSGHIYIYIYIYIYMCVCVCVGVCVYILIIGLPSVISVKRAHLNN